jgi:hypothetical protein
MAKDEKNDRKNEYYVYKNFDDYLNAFFLLSLHKSFGQYSSLFLSFVRLQVHATNDVIMFVFQIYVFF